MIKKLFYPLKPRDFLEVIALAATIGIVINVIILFIQRS